uniref:Uncharacterized protein n=1 Tax=Ascaris lumbricoides TaxID=6252 RepID=A0A0M3IS02_ASCLU
MKCADCWWFIRSKYNLTIRSASRVYCFEAKTISVFAGGIVNESTIRSSLFPLGRITSPFASGKASERSI